MSGRSNSERTAALRDLGDLAYDGLQQTVWDKAGEAIVDGAESGETAVRGSVSSLDSERT